MLFIKIFVDGCVIEEWFLFDVFMKCCFVKMDFYLIFFGIEVNDEIEWKLFGDIDMCGL